MANYQPALCKGRLFLSVPLPPKTLSHSTFGRRKKNWAQRREKRGSASGDESLSLPLCVYLFFQPIWQQQGSEGEEGGGVCW